MIALNQTLLQQSVTVSNSTKILDNFMSVVRVQSAPIFWMILLIIVGLLLVGHFTDNLKRTTFWITFVFTIIFVIFGFTIYLIKLL